jgi:hypothetical protein
VTFTIAPFKVQERYIAFSDLPVRSAYRLVTDTLEMGLDQTIRIKYSDNDGMNTFSFYKDGSCGTRDTPLIALVVPIQVTLTRTK